MLVGNYPRQLLTGRCHFIWLTFYWCGRFIRVAGYSFIVPCPGTLNHDGPMLRWKLKSALSWINWWKSNDLPYYQLSASLQLDFEMGSAIIWGTGGNNLKFARLRFASILQNKQNEWKVTLRQEPLHQNLDRSASSVVPMLLLFGIFPSLHISWERVEVYLQLRVPLPPSSICRLLQLIPSWIVSMGIVRQGKLMVLQHQKTLTNCEIACPATISSNFRNNSRM